jgi:hypothetical protein
MDAMTSLRRGFFAAVIGFASACAAPDGDGPMAAGAAGGASSASGSGGEGGGFDPGLSPPCQAAIQSHASVGCEYFATRMDTLPDGACFAAFVANVSDQPAHIEIEWGGTTFDAAEVAKVPSGSGSALSYQPFDAKAGIPSGAGVILFLAGNGPEDLHGCPFPAAVPTGAVVGTPGAMDGRTGIGRSFRISSDAPVVAYQMLPFGGGTMATMGASLLVPTSAWDTSYIAANAYGEDYFYPSMNIVARQDDTKVTLLPTQAVVGGGGVPAGPADAAIEIVLQRGEHAQISQPVELTGSVVTSTAPIGLMAGHQMVRIPDPAIGGGDHAEQMIPPLAALGTEYVGVMHEPRGSEPALWRLIGAIDGTELDWSIDVGGPATLERGQVVEIAAAEAFVVRSQDDEHPFILLQMMAGSGWNGGPIGRGDPDVVLTVPPQQYLSRYVFFTDPTFANTHLVIVRAKTNGAFADVVLDCAGALDGWQPVGSDYELTRVRINQGEPYPWGEPQGVGGCDVGAHRIESDSPFGLYVWGWDDHSSYGYPGGMGVLPVNDAPVPVPK